MLGMSRFGIGSCFSVILPASLSILRTSPPPSVDRTQRRKTQQAQTAQNGQWISACLESLKDNLISGRAGRYSAIRCAPLLLLSDRSTADPLDPQAWNHATSVTISRE